MAEPMTDEQIDESLRVLQSCVPRGFLATKIVIAEHLDRFVTEILRLREENERLQSEAIADAFNDAESIARIDRLREENERARKLLEELAKYFSQGKQLYDTFPSVEDSHNEYASEIRAFLDGEDA